MLFVCTEYQEIQGKHINHGSIEEKMLGLVMEEIGDVKMGKLGMEILAKRKCLMQQEKEMQNNSNRTEDEPKIQQCVEGGLQEISMRPEKEEAI
eukprot:c30490_g1_i1 orf=252-533(+)